VYDLIFIIFIGLTIGSFLNVCIWRIPRDESISFPPSHCPSCDIKIKPWDNIPVLSYMILGGKCRGCKTHISARYPMVEILNAIMYAAVYMRFGIGWHLPVLLAFVSSLIVISFIDLDHQIIPDGISLSWIPIGILAGTFLLPDPFMRDLPLGWAASLIGAVSGFGLFFFIIVASRGGMGGGDAKMMAMVGATLGWKAVLLTTFTGSLLGSIVGGFLMIAKGKGGKTKVPFGPFLAIGALISLFFGQEIMGWYLNVGR
jgi:leader peptidase (prepilin peptidase)/N-methyltransferase